MDFIQTIELSRETYQELVHVGQDTFLVVVGVGLHSFLWHYKMGTDLGVENADHPDPDHKRDRRYWLCHLLCLIVLVSLTLRFLVGSRAHSISSFIGLDRVTVDVWRFVRNFVFLIAFGVILVRAALSQSHRSFMKWLAWFSAVALAWCWCDGTPWGQWWWKPNLLQGLVTLTAWWVLGERPAAPGEEAYGKRLVIVLSGLGLCYFVIFPWDLWHIVALSSSAAGLAR